MGNKEIEMHNIANWTDADQPPRPVPPMNDRDEVLDRIARECLLVDSLEVANSDSLDFHDLHVGNVRDALELAYKAGEERGYDNCLDDEAEAEYWTETS